MKAERSNVPIYDWPQLSKLKMILLSSILFGLGFVGHFPLNDIIDSSLEKIGNTIPSCPIKLNNSKLSLLPLGIKLGELSVPSFCLSQQGGDDIQFKQTHLKFSGFSFSPIGPMFTFNSYVFKNQIEFDLVPGFGTHGLRIENQKLQISPILAVFNTGFKIDGNLLINALIKMNAKGLSELTANIQSKNFAIPSQNIQGLKLPHLNLSTLSLKTTSTGSGNIFVDELIVGKEGAPIRAKFKGSVKPHDIGFVHSALNLDGEIFFSEDFKKQFALINMLMQKYPQVNGFYKVKIGGTIASPQFN